MKIISWNCSGKFREKFKYIRKYDADIYVIQECEDPEQVLNKEFDLFSSNYIWSGENKNKGVGIFARDGILLTKNNWSSFCLREFLSVSVNNNFDLLAVWACKPYIEEYYIYQNINIGNYNNKTVLIGDFNSNFIWDKAHQKRTHGNVVRELNDIGIVSVYHFVTNERQGEETQKTFYLYRHLDKGYHIDHCFTDKRNVKNYCVLYEKECLDYSDHMPICLEIND